VVALNYWEGNENAWLRANIFTLEFNEQDHFVIRGFA